MTEGARKAVPHVTDTGAGAARSASPAPAPGASVCYRESWHNAVMPERFVPTCPPWCETVRPVGPGVAVVRWFRRRLGMRVSPRLCRACWQEATDWLFRRAKETR